MPVRARSYREEAYERAVKYQYLVYGENGKFSVKGFIRAMYDEIGRPGKYIFWGCCGWFIWYQCTMWVCKDHSSAVQQLVKNEEDAFYRSGTPIKGEEYIIRSWQGHVETDEICPPMTPQAKLSSYQRFPEIKTRELEKSTGKD